MVLLVIVVPVSVTMVVVCVCQLPLFTVVSAKSLDVRKAQRMLNQLGYNAGAVDGAYGKKTRGTLEDFYANNSGSSVRHLVSFTIPQNVMSTTSGDLRCAAKRIHHVNRKGSDCVQKRTQ